MRSSSRLSALLVTALAGASGAAVLALVPAAATAATAAPSASAPRPEHARVVVTAHRGAMAYAPENTMAAFELGVAQRADQVESDVQRTKDGVLVLMHDTTLSRTTDVEEVFPGRAPWRVADFTYAEIRRLDAGSWFSQDFAGERVPTMAEMVQRLRRSRAGILMELKSPALYPGIEAQVAREFSRFPGYVTSAVRSGRLVVQSFDWASMERYHRVQPSVPVGLLGRPDEAMLPELATWADQVNPGFPTFDAAYVDAVHALGMEVHTYTVNEPADMHAVLDRGVDGVITNVPDVLHDVLRDRRRGGGRAAA